MSERREREREKGRQRPFLSFPSLSLRTSGSTNPSEDSLSLQTSHDIDSVAAAFAPDDLVAVDDDDRREEQGGGKRRRGEKGDDGRVGVGAEHAQEAMARSTSRHVGLEQRPRRPRRSKGRPEKQ